MVNALCGIQGADLVSISTNVGIVMQENAEHCLFCCNSFKWSYRVYTLFLFQGRYGDETSIRTYIHLKNFKWLDLENKTTLEKCRNSVQGPTYIADEQGKLTYVQDLLRVNLHISMFHLHLLFYISFLCQQRQVCLFHIGM